MKRRGDKRKDEKRIGIKLRRRKKGARDEGERKSKRGKRKKMRLKREEDYASVNAIQYRRSEREILVYTFSLYETQLCHVVQLDPQ